MLDNITDIDRQQKILMKRKKKGAAKWKIEYAWNAEQKIHMNLEI